MKIEDIVVGEKYWVSIAGTAFKMKVANKVDTNQLLVTHVGTTCVVKSDQVLAPVIKPRRWYHFGKRE